MSFEEKYSSNRRSDVGIEWLQGFTRELGLRDIRSSGVFCTWTNNKEGDRILFEKLDRVMADEEWQRHFPKAASLFLPIQRSDHSPIIVDLCWKEGPKCRPKRFEEVWPRAKGVQQIISRVWGMSVVGSSGYQLVQKQKILMRHLCNWKDLSYNSLRRKIKDFQCNLERVQMNLAGHEGDRKSTNYGVRSLRTSKICKGRQELAYGA